MPTTRDRNSDRQRNFWSAECRGKHRYSTKRIALSAKRVMVKAGRAHNAQTLNPYKCRVCGNWHLGNDKAAAALMLLPPPLKIIRASVGDTVEIIWRGIDGTDTKTRHTAPQLGEHHEPKVVERG